MSSFTSEGSKGSVAVSNFPAVQPVNDNGGSLTVDGTVAVSNFPATQAVTGTFWQTTQPVSGTVNISYPVPASIVGGSATTNGATIITVPAGRTWRGSVSVSASNGSAAAFSASVVTSGTGVSPTAGTALIGACGSFIGLPLTAASAAPGNAVSDVYVSAPVGNSVSLVLNTTASNTIATANGTLL